jgi:protein-tyrosine phosphatase
MKILFVCTGNVCRSPMAEVIFRNICRKRRRSGVIVRSAGTTAETGSDMTPQAKFALQSNGYILSKRPHKATQFTEEMRGGYDFIICLNGKLNGVRDMYVDDPWCLGQDAYNIVCRKLQTELILLYKEIFGL